MPNSTGEFQKIVITILDRFFEQNGRAALSIQQTGGCAARLAELVTTRNLPPLLRPGDLGKPGSISDTECAPLVGEVLGDLQDPLLADAVRQLIKACFNPRFGL